MKNLILGAVLATMAFVSSAAIIPASQFGNPETGDNIWEFTDTSGNVDDAGFVLTAEFGGSNSGISRSFGLYQYDAVGETMLNSLQIFDSADLLGLTSTSVNLDQGASTVTTQYGFIDTSLALGEIFGFYFTSDGTTTYSQEGFNPGDADFFGFYDESDPFSLYNNHIYAEDNSGQIDWVTMSITDINTDRIVGTTVDVPEPASALLLGAGLLGLVTRRKLKAA
jgi:hypothetical protein